MQVVRQLFPEPLNYKKLCRKDVYTRATEDAPREWLREVDVTACQLRSNLTKQFLTMDLTINPMR